MTGPELTIVLHAGHDLSFATYLTRVLLALGGFGGAGLAVYVVAGVLDAV